MTWISYTLRRGKKEDRVKNSHTRREFLRLSAFTFISARFSRRAADTRVTTVVGSGARGMAADGDAANRAQIDNPFHIAMGPDGAIYFSDFGTSRVFRWDLRTSSLHVVAGNASKRIFPDRRSAANAP